MSEREEFDKLLDAGGASKSPEIKSRDIPESCLEGFLGEICSKRMHDLPMAWAWPAILAAASAHASHCSQLRSVRSNLYVALIGSPGSGKTSAINVANYLLDVKDDLFRSYVGSAEGLAKNLPSEFSHKLWFIDELGQMLDKARIEGASFVRILNSAFYDDEVPLVASKGISHKINCKLSIIGGIVEEEFEDAFSAVTAFGLYDRFIFGCAAPGYVYDFHPLEDYGKPIRSFDRNLVVVEEIHADVWELKKQWRADNPTFNREFEIALRCALICASFDGRKRLAANDLASALEFAKVQGTARILLKPNMGKNQGGELSQKIMDFLHRYAPGGEFLKLRDVQRGIHAHKYGADLTNRTLNALSHCGDIEISTDRESPQKPRIVRLAI